MKHHLTARPYEPGDYEFVYELKKLCYHDYVEALWGWKEDDQRRRFAAFMEEGAGDMMAIILQDGRAVGMVNWELPDEDTLMLCNICLLPQCRGQGFGGRLLQSIINGCSRTAVQLQVYKTNPARQLYERLGFRVTGETDHHYRMEVRKEK